jgi:hypothetical protein
MGNQNVPFANLQDIGGFKVIRAREIRFCDATSPTFPNGADGEKRVDFIGRQHPIIKGYFVKHSIEIRSSVRADAGAFSKA